MTAVLDVLDIRNGGGIGKLRGGRQLHGLSGHEAADCDGKCNSGSCQAETEGVHLGVSCLLQV
jgi:hypothetical protein